MTDIDTLPSGEALERMEIARRWWFFLGDCTGRALSVAPVDLIDLDGPAIDLATRAITPKNGPFGWFKNEAIGRLEMARRSFSSKPEKWDLKT